MSFLVTPSSSQNAFTELGVYRAAEGPQREQPRVVPSRDVPVRDELVQLALDMTLYVMLHRANSHVTGLYMSNESNSQ